MLREEHTTRIGLAEGSVCGRGPHRGLARHTAQNQETMVKSRVVSLSRARHRPFAACAALCICGVVPLGARLYRGSPRQCEKNFNPYEFYIINV